MSASLQLRAEWLDGGEIRAPELAATFCRLEVWVGDRCPTRVEDQRTGATRNGIFCSAYPLAEWLATRWWSLRWHVRGAVHGRDLDPLVDGPIEPLDPKHDLRAAGDGFLWPDLRIVPAGDQVLLTWSERTARDLPTRFLTSGTAHLDAEGVFASFAEFIGQVIVRLDASGLTSTLLHDEWQAITEADEPEATFCRAAASLGLDPYDASPEVAALLEQLGVTLGDALTVELAEAADLGRLAEDVRWAQDAERFLRAEVVNRATQDFAVVRQGLAAASLPPGQTPPFRTGWEQARVARAFFGADPDRRFAIEQLVAIALRPSADPALQGMALAEHDHLGVVVGVRTNNDAPGRFLAGRALWRALHSPVDRPFLLTTSATWSHRVERAFAAQLLAPAEGLRAQIGDERVVDPETVSDLARHFGVSGTLVRHQLENQLGVGIGDW